MKVTEEKLFCTKERLKELVDNKCVLKKSWKEWESMNDLLYEKIVLKESQVLQLEDEIACEIQRRYETCFDAYTQPCSTTTW